MFILYFNEGNKLEINVHVIENVHILECLSFPSWLNIQITPLNPAYERDVLHYI